VVQYQSQLELDGEQTKKVVKEITELIEQRLTELTINAPDWYVVFYFQASNFTLWKGRHSMRQDWALK
jgi:hypothetical protein